MKENIKILKEERKRDKEMRRRENEMAETELQRLRTEATEHQKENKELTQKLADEGRNAKSTIDKQTTIITGLESVILSYIQTRVKWAKGLELHELRKQVESLRVQINNQSDADHGAIYELCNKIHMSRNFPSVDDELRRLEDEHKKTIKGGIEVVRQFFISMDRDEADSKDVERPVKREEPDPNTMSYALQSAGLRCTPMLEHMKPFFSQEFRNTVGADMAQPTDMYNIYRPVFLLLQRFLQNKGTMKHKLSVLQEVHSECDKNLQRSKRSAEALQTSLDSKTKTAANNREELCKLKAQWSEVHELIKTALRLYETKSSTREDPGDEGSAESRIKTTGKALDRSLSRKADKNTDLPIGESCDKSRNQDLEQRIKDCLRKGDLADRAVLRRWHIMWCGCENFRIDGDVVSTTGTCTLHGVPATVSASSDASKLCYSMLEWMEGVFSYRQESLRTLKVEVCNGEEEIDKLRQTGTEREATAKRTLELLEQNIAHETKRYDALKERFDTIEQGNSILNFVASVQDKTQNSDVVLEPRPPKSGEWANPQVITCLHTILCGCALDLSNLSELTFDPAKYNDCKRVFRSILPESIEAEIDEQFATGSKFLLSTVAKRCKLEAKLVEDLKASLRARDALCRENEALKNEADAKRADSKKIIHLHRRAFLDFARLIVEPFSEGFLQHGDKGSTKCKNREVKLNQVRLWLTPLEEGNVESDDEKLTAPIEICTGPEPADDTEKIFSQLVRVQEVANREQEFNKLVAVKVELQEKVANKTRQYEKLKNSFDTIEKHNLMVKFVVSVQDKAQHSNLALEPRLKTGDWANPEVIKCLHIILCGCTVSFSNVNETTFDPAKYRTCTSEFLSALPERITAHVYKEYEPYYKFLSAVAKTRHLEARLEDSNAISRAKDEISQENEALKKQVESKRAELKRIVHLHRKAFLDFARLIVEPFTEGFLQHGDERSVKGQSREVKLNEVRLWLTPLMEGNSKLKDDGLTAPVTIYTDSNSATDIEEIFSLLGRMQDVAASEKDLKDARATLRSTEDEHRRSLEGLNEQLKNVKARHTLFRETLRALSGSPASVQKFTGCLESGKFGTKENTERLHLLLSNSSESGLPKTHSVHGCQDTDCTAAFLHNFRLPAGGEIDAGPGSAVNCDISDELSLLEQVKMFWVFKKGLDDKLYSTFARHGPQAADSNPVATQSPPDDLLRAADLLGALKIDSMLSVLEQYIDEGEGREGKKKIHSAKQEKAVRRMAEFGGLDSKTISACLNCEKPGNRNQFLSQKREQGSTNDEDIENDVAKSMKATALRRCERLIERITMIQSRSEEQETRHKRDLEKLWAICQEWLGLGDQWPHSYEKITSAHGGKLAVGDQLAFIINAIEDAAQNVQNIERKYDNQYEEFKTQAKSDVELSKILRMTTWPSEVPGFPERILHKSRALQQIKGLCLEFNRIQFIFALKDFNAAKAESQTTECILDSAMKGGLHYEGLTTYLETASSKVEEVRLKISEGSDTSESNEVFSFYKPIIRLVLSLQRKDAEQASWISDCSRKMVDLYTKYGRSSCAVESGTKKPEEMMCNENAPLTSRLESLVTFVAELPSQKLDKLTHKFAGEDHHATKELNAAIAKSSEKIATFEKLVRIIQDAEAKLDKRYNDLKRNPDIPRSVLGSMQLQSKEVSLPDRLEARLEQAGVIGFVEGFWNEWQLETGRVKLLATLSSSSSGLGNIDEAMIKQAHKTAKDVGLYCEEFVNIFPMLERKYTAGAGASNEVFVLYKPMIEAAIFAGQGPLLSEAIMTLYACHGGNRGPLLPSRPEKDSVDLVPVKGSVVSNDVQIRDQTQPLTLRLRALVDFVASKSESATALPPVPADKNILREVEIIRQSWEEPNVDINGQLQGSGKPNRQRICNNPTEIRDTLTIHGKKVKIVRIKPRGKNYEFEVVDHNNERRMDLTSLSKILMEGTPSDVKDNADVIYAIFVRALVSVHPKVQLKKNDKKSEDLPKMIRFQHIKERVEKASPEMWLVQYRDGGQEEVSRGTISGWGLDAREQMKAKR